MGWKQRGSGARVAHTHDLIEEDEHGPFLDLGEHRLKDLTEPEVVIKRTVVFGLLDAS